MRACSEAAEPACSMHVSTSTVLPQRAGLHCRRMHACMRPSRFCAFAGPRRVLFAASQAAISRCRVHVFRRGDLSSVLRRDGRRGETELRLLPQAALL